MEIVKVFFKAVPDNAMHCQSFAISGWYAKPAILGSLAFKINQMSNGLCLFVSCSKYGCRQFLPIQSKFFPVHNLDFIDYKENLPWCVIEFNDYVLNSDDLSSKVDRNNDRV